MKKSLSNLTQCLLLILFNSVKAQDTFIFQENEYTHYNGYAAYVQAHPDDWQLFRGEVAYNDVSGPNKVTFIYTTAGDWRCW